MGVAAGIVVAVLGWLAWTTLHARTSTPGVQPTVAQPLRLAPSFTPSAFRVPYRTQRPGAVEVLLRNENSLRLVIDSVTLQPVHSELAPVPAWATAAVVWPPTADHRLRRAHPSWPRLPHDGLPVAAYLGGAVLVVSVDPPCASLPSTGVTTAVVRYHSGSMHFEQTIHALPAGGRAWFNRLVLRTCHQ